MSDDNVTGQREMEILNTWRRSCDFVTSLMITKGLCEAALFCSDILKCHFRIVICQRSFPLFDIKVGQPVKNALSATVV